MLHCSEISSIHSKACQDSRFAVDEGYYVTMLAGANPAFGYALEREQQNSEASKLQSAQISHESPGSTSSSSSSSSSTRSTAAAEDPSSGMPGCQVPYEQLLLTLIELQLLHPTVMVTRGVLYLASWLVQLLGRQNEGTIADRTSGSQVKILLPAILGHLGLGVKHAAHMLDAMPSNNSRTAAALTVDAELKQHFGNLQEYQQFLLLKYGAVVQQSLALGGLNSWARTWHMLALQHQCCAYLWCQHQCSHQVW